MLKAIAKRIVNIGSKDLIGCKVVTFSDFIALNIKKLAKKAQIITEIKMKILKKEKASFLISQKNGRKGIIIKEINKKEII
jgi:hypothetical protein